MTLACPICLSRAQQQLLDPQNVPVMMHRLYNTAEQARNASLGRLDMHRCCSCGFVWNAAFDPTKLQYDSAYENDQGHSNVFRQHMLARANAVVKAIPSGKPLKYLEVGCGQGTFLDCVADKAASRLQSADGFDPAYRGRAPARPSIRFHRYYFERSTSRLLEDQPNAVVSRHTIEHVPDPVAFLRSIRAALAYDSEATIFIETPDVDWIIANGAIQDFFYGHCSIFTAEAMDLALRRAGFQNPHVERVFGTQYLWARAHAGIAEEAVTGNSLKSVQNLTTAFVEKWRDRVSSAGAHGCVALWGAGAKGVTFSLLVDPTGAYIDHAVDINPKKQGHFLPVSGLPVLSPVTSSSRRPTTIFVMNPVYLSEIAQTAATAGISARLIAIN